MRRLEPEEIENQLFPIARRGYERDKVDAFLRVVAEFYRGALRAAEAEVVVAPEPPAPAPRRSFDRLGDQIAAVLGTAEQAAEDLKLNAEREAQHMRRSAAEEAAETTQAATNQLALARQLKANAQQEVEALLTEAREEAARLKQEAHVVSARLEQNARERAAEVEQAAVGRLEEVAAEARRRYDQLANASQQSIDHIFSVEALLAKARDELTMDRLTARNAGYSPDGDAGPGPSGPTERERPGPSGPTERERPGPSGPTERERLAASGREREPAGEDAGATWAPSERRSAEAVVLPPEDEAGYVGVASFAEDAAVEDAARKAEETMNEAMKVKPAPTRRRGAGSAARPRPAARRTGAKSVRSANTGPPPDQS